MFGFSVMLIESIPPSGTQFRPKPSGFTEILTRCCDQYASAHTVISARLHASLPAYGICGTRVLNLSVDVRGSAVEVFPIDLTMIPVISPTPTCYVFPGIER